MQRARPDLVRRPARLLASGPANHTPRRAQGARGAWPAHCSQR